MRFSCLLVTVGFSSAVGALTARQPEDANALMLDLNNEAIQTLEDIENTPNSKRSQNTCNIFTATVRKDW